MSCFTVFVNGFERFDYCLNLTIISVIHLRSKYNTFIKILLSFLSGYGHITPATNTGRAVTIVYAIFGIPIFLILLADFGKLFTRVIKFVWAYVRRLYYTGSLRRVRKQAQVQVAFAHKLHFCVLTFQYTAKTY